ncbi:regulatory protein RecX [Alphaproteobacteria bacterium LSUCC0684]
MRYSDEKLHHRLTGKAVHYLGRYASTTARLEVVLKRFAERKLSDAEPGQVSKAIDHVIKDCVSKGYVNDQLYAEQKTTSLRRQGRSRRMIEKTLAARGLDRSVIGAALMVDAEADDMAHEWAAALIHARRRRLGPFASERDKQGDLDKIRQRHLASFARAGFNLALAGKILALKSPEDAEEMLAEMQPFLNG